jgi:hypothetical protein
MVNSGVTATLNALKVTKGYISSGEGAGLQNNGTLTVNNSTFDSNVSGGQGGGITNLSTLTVQNSTFSNNRTSSSGCGGGINNGGTLTVLSSTFFNNQADCGGGISGGNPYTVANSTFYNNTATGARGGGALFNNNLNIAVTNSTLSGNTASGGPGGGISLQNSSSVLNLSNTIIANSTGGDCYTPGSLGTTKNNLISNSGANACNLVNGTNGNKIGVNPLLNALAANGGPTQTMALQTTSPAIDAGDNATCLAAPVSGLDQRGQTRFDLGCDIGAYETQLSDSASIVRSLQDGATYTFGPTLAKLVVTTRGTCTSLTIERVNANHPNAGGVPNFQTGVYWNITPAPAGCSGFNGTLLLPALNFTPDTQDKLCRWAGSWDCGTTNTLSTQTLLSGPQAYIQRTGVTAFSSWTLANNAGPTSVTLRSFAVRALQRDWWAAALLGLLLVVASLAITRRKRA